MTLSNFKKQTNHFLYNEDQLNVYVSPDFQCDQTGGFPVSLCVNWNVGKAWLMLNDSLINEGEDISKYEQMCADFGIRECWDAEQFNQLLRELGKDAVQSAEII